MVSQEFRSRKIPGWGFGTASQRPVASKTDCGYDKARCGNIGPSHFSMRDEYGRQPTPLAGDVP